MKIIDAINKIKAYYKGIDGNWLPINEQTTRDQILYGDADRECTGIVTTCWASIDVIKKAHELGANLIISHEALFWNHGDKTDWLENEQNQTFLEKKKLLDETQITVWRNHDYIHTGMPLETGEYVDGIFYGLAKKLGWENAWQDNGVLPFMFEIPATTAEELGKFFISKLNLNGVKLIGNPAQIVRKVGIAPHIMGHDDRKAISAIEKSKVDLVITLELVEFTVTEYVKDSSDLGLNKVILSMGHFNAEEPGMEYMLTYLPEILGDKISCNFVQSGDMYNYLIAPDKS